MKCNEYDVLLNKLLDGELTPEEEKAMAQHEAECPDCAARREAMLLLQEDLSALDEDIPPMPEDLAEGWMSEIRKEAAMQQTESTKPAAAPKKRIHWVRWVGIAAAAVLVLGGTLMTRDILNPAAPAQNLTVGRTTYRETSAAQNTWGVMADEDAYEYEYEPMEEAAEALGDTALNSRKTAQTQNPEAKIIRTASLTIATLNFDDALKMLEERCTALGGWVASASVSENSQGLHTASMNLRVPAAELDGFLGGVGDAGRITRRDETATDVTESYRDTQMRLETQKALMTRLQALVPEAASLTELLELESQIADTQYQIDALTSSLNATDRKVSYSTVSVTLREEKPEEKAADTRLSFGERLGAALAKGFQGFTGFLGDVLMFLTAALPFLALIGAVVLIIVLVRRRSRAKGKREQTKP